MADRYLILNYKTYPESTGENAVKLTQIVADQIGNTDVNVIICPQAADIYRVREQFPHIQIWAQHIDPIEPGRNTGWTSPETVVMAGADGSIINHSEHKLDHDVIQSTIKTTQAYKLRSCVAFPDIETGKLIATYSPDIIAFEPPELISTSSSLVEVDVELAQQCVAELGSEHTLILGAGIKTAGDVSSALEMGYKGFILSSGFVKAEDPAKFLVEMLAAFAG